MDFFYRMLSAGEEASEVKLTVSLTPRRNCFVSLPVDLASSFHESYTLPLALRLTDASKSGRGEKKSTWHVAWAGDSSPLAKGRMEVPLELGRCIGLLDGAKISLRPLPDIEDASAVSVSPASEDDWELVELHAEYMEEQILNQVGVVEVGKEFPFWVTSQSPLRLIVEAAEPQSIVKLNRNLELSVAPRPRKRGQGALEDGLEEEMLDLEDKHVTWLRLQEQQEEQLLSLRRESNEAASTSSTSYEWKTVNTTTMFVRQETAQLCGVQAGQCIAFAASPLSRKLVLKLAVSSESPAVHATMAGCVLSSIQLSHHKSAAFWKTERFGAAPDKIVLHPINGSVSAIRTSLRFMKERDLQLLVAAWVDAQRQARAPQGSSQDSNGDTDDQDEGIPITDGSVMMLQDTKGKIAYFFMDLRNLSFANPKPALPFHLTRDMVTEGRVKLEIGEAVSPPSWPQNFEAKKPGVKPQLPYFGEAWMLKNLQPCLERALPLLHHPSREAWWKLRPPTPGGLLVCGPTGSGKTGLTKMLGHILETHEESQAHVVYVDCNEIDVETLANAKKEIELKLQEAVACMPSLIIFDNLHLICPSEPENPEAQMQMSGTAAMTSWLCDVLHMFKEQPHGRPPYPVVTCATAPTPTDLAETLRAAGRLDRVIQLQPPGALERQNLLSHAVRSRGFTCSPKLLQEVALKADGCDASDLQAFVDRAVHAVMRRSIVQGARPSTGKAIEIGEEDLDSAWEGFSPAASWGVSKGEQSNMVEGWEDVGGLHDVIDALKEALELPMKYAKLLSRAPLRLRTGVLLFGPPGCGKTHVVSAAVAASGARFISVKGPELLNKYIGASEAAVRNVFRQASAAAPCVLFFDEFDAIAPQRGHDSTGVTDRVVNQLLTELDGIEGLKGVVVLAATSRPDLLDAALLRPGRLDRLMFCGMPSQSDRLAILQALSKRLTLAPRVNLESIAEASNGYTGADLGALLSDAQLAAVHEMIDNKSSGAKAGKYELTAQHLETAMKSARPSLSIQEQLRLLAIYSRFKNSRSSGLGNKEPGEKRQLKATLG